MMGHSFKALIERQKSVGQPVGQSWDKAEKPCPTAESPVGQEFARPEGGVVPLFGDERAEREAIAEYDSAIPRPWAVAFALLITSPCPSWMTAEQWKRHHDAAGKLLASWAAQMDRLGWLPAEVLGIDERWPAKPWEPCLLSALVGVTVGAVSANRISITFPDGGSRVLERIGGKWVYG